MKVMVTDGGTGQSHGTVGVVRALAAAGHQVAVTVSGRFSTAAWSRYCQLRLASPPAHDERYPLAIRSLVEAYAVDLLLPTSDMALLALGLPGRNLVDKQVLAGRARAAGLGGAASRTFPDGRSLGAHAEELTYPVAVKAVTKEASHGFPVHRADGPADLAELARFPAPVFVEEWMTGEQRAICGVVWGGRLQAIVHQRYTRVWPPVCGVSCFARTIPPDTDLEARVLRLLDGYDGMFQCQLIGNTVHDVNPRAYGSVALATHAGVNLPAVVADLSTGNGVEHREPLRARPGVHYRWVEGDVRHLLHQWRSGATELRGVARGLRPVKGTAHPDVSLSDPGPTLARLAYVLSRSGS